MRRVEDEHHLSNEDFAGYRQLRGVVLGHSDRGGPSSKTDSELHVVYVRHGTSPPYPGHYLGPQVMENYQQREWRALAGEAKSLLEDLVVKIEATGGNVAQIHLRVGKADREIVALADELVTGLIVIGSPGWGRIKRALMGEVSEEAICHAHCPVLVVRKDKTRSSL